MRNWTVFFIWIGICMAGPVRAQQWEMFQPPCSPAGIIFLRTLESNVFVYSWDGLYRTVDAGEHWNKVRHWQDLNGWQIVEVDKNTNRIYFTEGLDTSGYLKLFRSANMGNTWSYIGDVRAGLSAFIGDSIYGQSHITGMHIMRKWGNNPWQAMSAWPSDTAGLIHGLCAVGKHLWVASEKGIYHSPDAGHTWEFNRPISNTPDAMSDDALLRIEALNGDIVVTNDVDNRIYYTGDNGASWQEAFWGGRQLYNSGEHLFATDSTGTRILRFDGGSISNWNISAPTNDKNIEMHGVGEYNGNEFIGSLLFGILRKWSGSDTWQLANGNVNQTDGTLCFWDDHLFVLGRGQQFSSDNGATWKTNLRSAFPVLAWRNGNYDYSIKEMPAQKHGVVRCPRNQRFEWETHSLLPIRVSGIAASGDTILGMSEGSPYRLVQSIDNGLSWNVITAPFGKTTILSRQGKFYLVKGASLYVSADVGNTWDVVYTFPHTQDETAGKFIMIGDTILLSNVSLKRLYLSSDGGLSFSEVPTPHNPETSIFSLSKQGENLLSLVVDDFIIHLSKDEGQTWQSVAMPDGYSPAVLSNNYYSTYGNNTFVIMGYWKLRLDGQRQVAGKVFLDANGNGVENAGESRLNNWIVKASGSSALGTTYQNGHFSLLLDSGAHTLSMDQLPPYYTVSPLTVPIPSGNDPIPDVTFAIQPQVMVHDVALSLVSAAAFRAGYDNTLHIRVKNAGTLPASGSVKLVPDPLLTILDVLPAPDATSGDTLIWYYTDLAPLGEQKIRVEVNTAVVPPNTPVAVWAAVETQADVDLANNFVLISEEVVSSFDPNDKAVSKTEIPAESADNEELTYTIRFQNLGNIETDFITVRDTLSEALDAATVRILTASHLYEWGIEEGRILVFRFNPIRLTPASEDSLRSQGFIQFAVGLKPGLQPGDEIANTAHIYFDFNPAVVTNTVVSSIQVVSTFEPSKRGIPLEIFPNPANTMATIRIPLETKDKGVLDIFSISGSRLYSISVSSNSATVDTQHLPAGTYWCLYKSGSQTVWGKLLIQ